MLFGMNTTTSASRQLEGFEDTVKDFWASRPRRPGHGRKLAGVAAGVGNRYGIDPAVIRVLFVVLTVFSGIGLPLYLLGWLVFAEEGDEVSGVESLFGKGHSSMSKGLALVLCVALVPLSGWAFAGSWIDGGAFVGGALVVAGLYLLHRNRGQFRRPVPTGPSTAYSATAGTSGDTGAWGPPVSQAPPTWDALGADPLGWRLPAPVTPAPPSQPSTSPTSPRRNSKVGLATVGVALAVGGAGTALAVADVPWFTPVHVIGLVLAVLAAGMVVGSFLGGGRGLLWLAVPLSLAGLAAGAVPVEYVGGGIGELTAKPTSAEQVEPVYERTMGQINLDLTGLTADSDPVETTVRTGVGSVIVLVPENADVTYRCETTLGSMSCFDHEHSGIDTPEITGVHNGADGVGGPKVTVTAETGAGNVEVLRE